MIFITVRSKVSSKLENNRRHSREGALSRCQQTRPVGLLLCVLPYADGGVSSPGSCAHNALNLFPPLV